MIDTVDKDIDVKLKDMMLEVRTSMHNLVNNRDGKPERFDDIIVTEMMKSQFHKWQKSFVRACLTAPRRRSGFFFEEEEDWLLDICAVNVTCG